MGQSEPGRGAAVLHYDGLLHRPRQHRDHPSDERHQPELMKVNDHDDITRWWEVMDRSTGQPVPPEQWSYADGSVTVQAVPFHEYTVSFLAYLIWDPVHMYNATTNGWTNFEHQITFDVRQPKTHKYSMERLRKFIAEHPYVNVIRYTTFFHQSP